VNTPATLHVGRLPTYGYGSRSLTWWATLGMVLIEGTVFLAGIASYFYLRDRVPDWPPEGSPPALRYGTVNLAIMLLSGIANHRLARAAHRERLHAVRGWIIVGTLFSVAFLLVRVFEYLALNTTYTGSAYGSIVFALLTLHTVHILTDFIDTVVLAVLMFTGPLEGRRYVDVAENCMYYWFVILSWIPMYLTIYVAPRL
jgi:heme/copper-type cytochrome/quinol oxidase subunit 3